MSIGFGKLWVKHGFPFFMRFLKTFTMLICNVQFSKNRIHYVRFPKPNLAWEKAHANIYQDIELSWNSWSFSPSRHWLCKIPSAWPAWQICLLCFSQIASLPIVKFQKVSCGQRSLKLFLVFCDEHCSFPGVPVSGIVCQNLEYQIISFEIISATSFSVWIPCKPRIPRIPWFLLQSFNHLLEGDLKNKSWSPILKISVQTCVEVLSVHSTGMTLLFSKLVKNLLS